MGNAIEIASLTKLYGRSKAVDQVDLVVEQGQVFGYLGPNGAGKTTTIRCLMGLLKPSSGTIDLLGRSLVPNIPMIFEQVGYLPGEFGLWPQMTGAQCLKYLSSLQTRPPVRQEELCKLFDLSEADLSKKVRRYSRGMRQKIALVQAFQHQPELAVLDEPTEGLDPVMKERFMELVLDHKRSGGSVFLSSHILSEVEQIADVVAVIRKGKVVKQSPTAELTGDTVRHCIVKLKKPVPASVSLDLPGLSKLEAKDLTLKFEYRGDMEPLIRVLNKLKIEEFLAEPESLMEAFFEVYESPVPASEAS